MKKFTTIAAALLLGSFGFTAMAQDPTIDPESGSTFTKLPDYITITWENATNVTVNPDFEGLTETEPFFPGAPTEKILTLDVSLNGTALEDPDFGGPVVWDVDPDPEFQGECNYIWVKIPSAYGLGEYSATIPAGSLLIDGEELEKDIPLVYTLTLPEGVNEITLDDTFKATENSKWGYSVPKSMELILNSNQKVNLVEEGTLTIYLGETNASGWWDASTDDNGYYFYSYNCSAGSTFIFTYTGDETVEFTLVNNAVETSELTAPNIEPTDGDVLTYATDVFVVFDTTVEPADWDECYALVSCNGQIPYTPVPLYMDDDYTFYISWESAIYDEDYNLKTGVYTFVIPEGMIVSQDDPTVVNSDIEWSYTLRGANANYTITPNPNAGVYPASDLSAVKISWPGLTFESYDSSLQILVSKVNDNPDDDYDQGGVVAFADDVVSADGVLNPDLVKVDEESATIQLNLSGIEVGLWRIEIPANYAIINEYTVTSKVELTYNIWDGLASATIIQPAMEPNIIEVINTPEPFKLTWNYQKVAPTAEGLSATLTFNTPEESDHTESVPASAFSFNEDNTVLTIDVVDLLDGVAGYVSLYIPEGIVANTAGSVNPAQQIDFQLVPFYTGAYEIGIASNGTSIDITYEGEGVEANPMDSETAPYVENAAGDQIAIFEIYDTVYGNGNWNGVVYDLSGFDLADGDYTLVITNSSIQIMTDEGTFVNSEILYQFTVDGDQLIGETTGINAVGSVNIVVEGVYNLQGVKMSNDLNSLAPGLYIINGKKVLVRK